MTDAKIPKTRPSLYQKCWWSKELAERRKEVCRLTHRAYGRRGEASNPIHHKHKAARRVYGAMIECAKMCHWEEFLEMVNEKSVWTAHHYASGDPMDGAGHASQS